MKRNAYLGTMTDFTAWITPLVVLMSALVTLMPLTDAPPARETFSLPPPRVVSSCETGAC